ncbi:MAG: AAA-like domain-containing protein, partial [Cyanobacteriota bacterium]|nr:AAA-like domain-containing protein [Cyanobacteriota bacterium]
MTYYQVGGSLNSSNPTYVARQADLMLYHSLIAGEFCYVFNARQMGKSSLRIRTKHRLEQEGFTCASVDLTRIGSENITVNQWYKSFVADLLKAFKLFRKVKLKSWWQDHEDRSNIQILSDFIEEVILTEIQSEKIFIFIDEIDSILSLKFSVDDFFALIRYCYNQRAENPDYNRLTFALFGVTTPSDLIQDKTRTPFNIGTAIELQGFQWNEDEIRPLADGLEGYVDKPISVLKEILAWTEGQPFLTQKVCQIVVQNRTGSIQSRNLDQDENHDLDENLPIANPQFFKIFNKFSTSFIENYVRSHIIKSWETKDEPEHLRTIR